jgi:hypothetical protein
VYEAHELGVVVGDGVVPGGGVVHGVVVARGVVVGFSQHIPIEQPTKVVQTISSGVGFNGCIGGQPVNVAQVAGAVVGRGVVVGRIQQVLESHGPLHTIVCDIGFKDP